MEYETIRNMFKTELKPKTRTESFYKESEKCSEFIQLLMLSDKDNNKLIEYINDLVVYAEILAYRAGVKNGLEQNKGYKK